MQACMRNASCALDAAANGNVSSDHQLQLAPAEHILFGRDTLHREGSLTCCCDACAALDPMGFLHPWEI